MDPETRKIMAKAASAIRQLEAENRSLHDRLDSLEKTASSSVLLGKQVEAAKAVLRLVVDGEADPADALEKFAQVCDLSERQIEEILRNGDSEKIGQVSDKASGDADNPLLDYLLGRG